MNTKLIQIADTFYNPYHVIKVELNRKGVDGDGKPRLTVSAVDGSTKVFWFEDILGPRAVLKSLGFQRELI